MFFAFFFFLNFTFSSLAANLAHLLPLFLLGKQPFQWCCATQKADDVAISQGDEAEPVNHADNTGPVNHANNGPVNHADNGPVTQADNGGPANHTVAPAQPQPVWPVETELLVYPGTGKVMLTFQRPLMRTVIQDAFELVHCSLLIKNAFPDTFIALDVTRDALYAAAESNKRASEIYNRLVIDAEYMTKMTRLVSFSTQFTSLLIHVFSLARVSHFFEQW
jgi:hypothetical protein